MNYFQLWVILAAIYFSHTMTYKAQRVTAIGFFIAAFIALGFQTFETMGG